MAEEKKEEKEEKAGQEEPQPEEKAEEKPEPAESPPEKSDEVERKAGKKHEKKKDVRKNIVRVGGKDLDGDKPVKLEISNIRGVSFTLANAAAKVSGLGEKKIGELKEDEIKHIEDILQNPGKHGIPSWMFNRRADPEEGSDKHVISAPLELRHKMDINELKKRKTYRGIRHIQGLPVRGQRTRSSFRKAATVGVSRAKSRPASREKK
ncbi:MAG: 30S ribosomal protein S13 [Candidatus Aenigmatarchaeota archaeon]|nr:MAG: 30S ribosomal protein S13 [Candidatus Aenigmarchaeota archaeon]